MLRELVFLEFELQNYLTSMEEYVDGISPEAGSLPVVVNTLRYHLKFDYLFNEEIYLVVGQVREN